MGVQEMSIWRGRVRALLRADDAIEQVLLAFHIVFAF
jgi:hypothetical protein